MTESVLDPWLMLGDTLERMKEIPDGSVDMVMADLPYGTTACKWDSVIPFAPLWETYRRVCKKNAAMVLTASQPFTSVLTCSNLKEFKYQWVWDKKIITGFLDAKERPLKRHEDILIFCKGQPPYNPAMVTGKLRSKGKRTNIKGQVYGACAKDTSRMCNQYYPNSILEVSNADRTGRVHPTQKPTALMEYLIRTYTNEGETVLDNTMGSGTTGVACVNTGRHFIGIERDEEYMRIAKNRINAAIQSKLPITECS